MERILSVKVYNKWKTFVFLIVYLSAKEFEGYGEGRSVTGKNGVMIGIIPIWNI